MSYSKSLLLYQDMPAYGLLLKLIVVIVPVGLLVTSIYLWFSGENTGGLVMLAEAFFIGLVFWVIFPRRYQVYEDHLRIVLGGPFAIRIGFAQITAIEVTSRLGLTVNFVTRITKTYVRIIKRNGLDVAITPKSNDSFVENANRALGQWSKIKL
jgi:hypothetical protein